MLPRLLISPLLLCLLFGSSLTFADKPTILVLGDSISAAYGINTHQGWVSLLQQRLSRQGFDYRIINASVSGDTTRTGLNRLSPALQLHQPKIVIVALGGNDGLRGLPFSEIENSLSAIISTSQQHGATVLLAGVRLPPNYGAAYNTRFDTLYRQLADRYHVALVPHLMDKVSDNRALMQADGIHPTAAGQKQIMQNIWKGLLPLLHPQQAKH